MTAVLDASAVLALLYREPGHDKVAALLPGAVVSTVNWAEIVAKLVQRDHPAPLVAVDAVRSLGLEVLPFTAADAARAGLLWRGTRGGGLSLGDRACLAVAANLPDGTAVTADQAWTNLDLDDVDIRLIR